MTPTPEEYSEGYRKSFSHLTDKGSGDGTFARYRGPVTAVACGVKSCDGESEKYTVDLNESSDGTFARHSGSVTAVACGAKSCDCQF